jgi:hypothetical protein
MSDDPGKPKKPEYATPDPPEDKSPDPLGTKRWHELYGNPLDNLDPLGIRKMRELYRNPFEGLIPKDLLAPAGGIAAMMAKSGIGRLGVSEEIARMSGGIGGSLAAMQEQIRNSIAPLSGLTEATQPLLDQFKPEWARVLGASVFAEQTSAFAQLAEQYRAFDTPAVATLSKQLADLAGPAASLLAAFERSSVLAKLEGVPGVIGTLSWLEPEADEGFVRTAALGEPTSGDGASLDIEVSIKCALCGGLVIAPQRDVDWQSDTKIVINVNVLPLCPTCIHEVKGSPEYWIEKLEELSRPKLTIIDGGAENSEHTDRVHLRLVEDSEPGEPASED